jgi:hypothetical protein
MPGAFERDNREQPVVKLRFGERTPEGGYVYRRPVLSICFSNGNLYWARNGSVLNLYGDFPAVRSGSLHSGRARFHRLCLRPKMQRYE